MHALQRLGALISHLPGLSAFGGKRGWLLTATLLVAVAMIIASGLLGHRRRAPSAAKPATDDQLPT